MTVVVTGVGGPAGVAVLQHLRAAGEVVVGVDADPAGVGLHLADVGVVVPRADHPDYGPALLKVAVAHGADALLATVAEEIGTLWRHVDDLADNGVATWLPAADAVATCLDKWQFAQCLEAAGVPSPATALDEAPPAAPPWILKPRFGRGSRDVYRVESAEELAVLLARVPDPLVQVCVPGQEFTVDALVDRDGVVRCVVPRWRTTTRGGISTSGTTFEDAQVTAAATAALAACQLVGPANVQGFVQPDGAVRITEINPRFSGGLPLSLAAGADLVGQYLRLVRGLPLEPEHLTWRPGITMLRHFAEVFVE